MTRHRLLILIFIVGLLANVPASAGTFKAAAEGGAPNTYIVVLANGVAAKKGQSRQGLPTVAVVARKLARAHGGQVQEVWQDALQGFVAVMTPARARKLAADPRVASVEQNSWLSAPVGDCFSGTAWQDPRPLPPSSPSLQTVTCADPAPLSDTTSGTEPACKDNWGLDRIDQGSRVRSGSYSFTGNGTGVHVYVMDGGIRSDHREFNDANGVSRVSGGVDARSNPVVPAGDTQDCNGHGTHVAAIVGGRTFGVAKNVLLHPVRLFGCTVGLDDGGTAYVDAAIRALNWIVAEVQQKRSSGAGPWPSIISWSGANNSTAASTQALIAAVQAAVNANVIVVQAGGNDSADYDPSRSTGVMRDACSVSFGRSVEEVIVVGGMDQNDGRWTRRTGEDPEYSNYAQKGSNGGSCIDIWAPAAFVLSAKMSGTDTTCRLSGTSMAAPHVAGVVALYLQSNPTATAAQVTQALRDSGTWGALQSDPQNPNYIGVDSDNVLLSSTLQPSSDHPPIASFTVSCPGRQCNFNALGSTDDQPLVSASYSWRFVDDVPLVAGDIQHPVETATGAVHQHVFRKGYTGDAILEVKDSSGKTDHFLRRVAVNEDAPPTASFTYSCTARACTFNASASTDDAGITSRTWAFGDGATASGTTTSHTYAAGGSYEVVLTVTDNAGQTDTRTQTLTFDLSPVPPANVIATGANGLVTITWTPASNATGYNVERKVSSSAWVLAQNVTGGTQSSVTDNPGATPYGVALYRVIARYGTTLSLPSNNDVAFVATFVDNPVAGNVTPVRADHLIQIRRAVNGLLDMNQQNPVYGAAALDPAVVRTQLIDDADFTSLLQNLNAARSGLALPPVAFRTTPAPNTLFLGTQMEDLRLGVR